MIHLPYIVYTVYGRRGTNGIPRACVCGGRNRERETVTLVSCGDNRRKEPDILWHPLVTGSLGMSVLLCDLTS